MPELIQTFLPLVLIAALIVGALYFILPPLTPIPFYPTNKKDLPIIAKLLLENQPTYVVDLGAGTGRVIFATLKAARTTPFTPLFVALEINPLLVAVLHLKRVTNAPFNKVHVVWGNIFNINLRSLFRWKDSNREKVHSRKFAVYIYPAPSVMDAISHKLAELPSGTIIVSYMLGIPGWVDKQVAHKRGRHDIFVYRR